MIQLATLSRVGLLSAVTLGLVFTGISAKAQISYNGDPEILVCDVLSSLGLGCGVSQKTPNPTSAFTPAPTFTPITQNTSGQTNQQANAGNSLQASIANVTTKRSVSSDEVILVKVPVPISTSAKGIRPTLGLSTNDAIFEIIKGQKHFIPTVDIFFDYGFDLSAVQSVTQEDLKLFPRVKLVNIYDNKGTYYITEGFMIRLIPNQQVFESYGNREEDTIVISKKEFNFYPRNQFVFIENPLTGDVFQVSDSGVKRYIVPQVLRRLKITSDQIAPINRTQFNAYTYGTPIIF